MATAGVNRAPMWVRSAEPMGAGTLTARYTKVTPEQYVNSGYFVLSSPAGGLQRIHGLRFQAAVGLAFWSGAEDAQVILGRKTAATMEDTNAAVLDDTALSFAGPLWPNTAMVANVAWSATSSPALLSEPSSNRELQACFERLWRIERSPWDPIRGRKPSGRSLENAKHVLRCLVDGPIPERIVPADRSVVLYFASGENYATVELHNNGKMLLLLSDGNDTPRVSGFTPGRLAWAVDQLRAHIA